MLPTSILISLLLAFAQGQPRPTGVAPSPVHPADQLRLLDAEVVAELLAGDLDALLKLNEKPARARTVNETFKRLSLCIRAGRRREAASVIDHLAELKIDLDLTRAVLDFLVSRREIDLAARLIERVPGSGREFESNIVGWWLTVDRKPRHEVDRWLADRGWTNDRTHVDTALNTDDPLTATEARDRGQRAAASSMPALAAHFFERALVMPFTHDDMERETSVLSMVPHRSDAEWERRFRARTRLALAKAYRDVGDAARAQAVLRQAASEDPSIVGDVAFADAAGRAQLASGARHVEQEIRASEHTHQNSRDYWVARARYFAARNERADASDAFERALTIARSERPDLGTTRRVLEAYAEYLSEIGARAQAWRLLRRELESGSAREVDWIFDDLGRLLHDENALVDDSEWSWRVLERRADWEQAAGLLEHLVRATPVEKRSAVVSRALALAPDGDRRRALPLARALRQAGEGAAAVPLFEAAVTQLAGLDRATVARELTGARRSALREQFRAEIQQNDWRRAEQTWSSLLQIEPSSLEASFVLSSTASAMVQLAEAAAHGGDGADAIRFRRAAANLDRTAGLEHLAGFPLTRYRAELTDFYKAMAARDPGSWVPAVALEKLRR